MAGQHAWAARVRAPVLVCACAPTRVLAQDGAGACNVALADGRREGPGHSSFRQAGEERKARVRVRVRGGGRASTVRGGARTHTHARPPASPHVQGAPRSLCAAPAAAPCAVPVAPEVELERAPPAVVALLRLLRLSVCACVAAATNAAPSKAATVTVGTMGGLMLQPTSHYYLAVYGATVNVDDDKQGLLTRLAYVERPEFRDAGFADKDYGGFLSVGTKVTKQTFLGGNLYAYLGVGRMSGYTKLDSHSVPGVAAAADGLRTSSSYAVDGPTATFEYATQLGRTVFALGHQTFIGYVDEFQLKSYVAWPYNFYHASCGVTF